MKTLKNCVVVATVAIMLSSLTTFGFAAAPGPSGSKVTIAGKDTVVVPDNVRVTFQAKYPQATNVVWYKVQDMKDDEFTDTYPGLYDPSDYYVTYNTDGTEYVTWYSPTGEWVMTTNTISSDKLPAPALKSLQDAYNGFTIVKVDEDRYNGGTRYDVKMTKGDEKVKVHVTADGQILKVKDKQ